MTPIEAIIGVFTSPALNAAAWGMAASFALCVLLVLTKRWHDALTIDHTEGVQKFRTAPTSRIGGVPTAAKAAAKTAAATALAATQRGPCRAPRRSGCRIDHHAARAQKPV